MRTKRSGPRFFRITKTKLFLAIIFFALIVYLAGIPVKIIPEVTLSVDNLPPVIILILLELVISYIVTCIVVFLFHRHRRK